MVLTLTCFRTYRENKPAAIHARWTMHVVPTSRTAACCTALAEKRHLGCLAAVNVMLRPHAAIQMVTAMRSVAFALHCDSSRMLFLRSFGFCDSQYEATLWVRI